MQKLIAKNFVHLSFLMIPLLFLATECYSQTTIQDYALFGGRPAYTAGNVQMGSSVTIQGGSVGSYKLVKSTGSVTINANVYSGGTIQLANSNSVSGRISSANSDQLGSTTTILSVGSSALLSGNIDVNGKIVVGGGTVLGRVTHPVGTLYTGPTPGGGNITGPPSLQGLPQMPDVASFAPFVVMTDLNSTQAITPGAFDNIKLSGNKTLTFRGTGTYVFDAIVNTGGTNYFVFDFQNNPTGVFKLQVHNNASLAKINVTMINGGNASRIFTEVHGSGTGGYSFIMDNGSSSNAATKWLGTVWASNAGISIGSGAGNSSITGALFSGTQVNLQSGVNLIYEPFSECIIPTVNAGPDNQLNFLKPTQLAGSTTTTGAQFSWSAFNGGILASGTNTLSPFISSIGSYVLTITNGTGCLARDTVVISGKINNLIGSELNTLYETHDTSSALSKSIFFISNDSVLIDVIALQGKYSQLKTLLLTTVYGLRDTISNGSGSLIITGKYPIANLRRLDSLPTLINHCRPVYPALSNSGVAQTKGDSAMRTNYVRNGFKVQGTGIKVGVLSDSYNTQPGDPAANDVTNGDLPGTGNPVNATPVEVLKEYPFGKRSDEGRAMLQIIHDIAPKSPLAFRTGFLTAGDFAQGIRELAANNCKVIVDDITFITEPFYKPGVVETAINDVSAAGVSYVTAAGNFGSKSYEAAFNPANPPAGLTGKAHNFGGGDILQSDSLKGTLLTPGVYTIVLQWVDDIYSLGTSTTGTVNDLDIYFGGNNGTSLFGVNRNNLGRDPIEVLPYIVTSDTVMNIVIVNASGTSSANLRFKYVVFRGDLKINEYQQGSSTIVGQGNANAAITVGAALYSNTPAFGVQPTVASFSSTGGTSVGGVLRNKPDIVGPNGVNTTVSFGSIDYDGDGLPNFFGTSAAAPHIAGAVALLMEAKQKFFTQTMGPVEAKDLLTSTSIDMYTPGFDFNSGYGFIQADSAMRKLANPTPQLIKLQLADSSLVPGVQPMELIIKASYLTSTTKIILGTDTLTTTIISNTEARVMLPVFSSEKFVTAFTRSITPSGLDGGLSNSISITGLAKKNIGITAVNKSKKYAEQMPVFTSVITVDGIPLQDTNLSLADLGLTNISYQSPGNVSSNVGIYFIRPSRVFDPNNAADALLLTKYNYSFIDGALTITKLPVTILPRDTTIVYGQKITDFNFNYSYDPAVTITDPATLLNNIKTQHETQLVDDAIGLVNSQAVTIVNGQAIPIVNGQAVTIINGQAVTIINGQAIPIVNSQAITIVNGQAIPIVNTLTPTETQNLSFLATEPAIDNAREITNQTLVNGNYVTETTKVIDITQESILKFNVNSAQTSMISSVSNANARGLADIESLTSSQAITIVNSQAITIVNGQAVTIVNGQAVTIINGQAVTIVNGQAIPIVNGENRTAVVVDQTDIGQGISPLKSVNMITGLEVGVESIIPGALLNDNLAISYGVGRLTILPAPVTIRANDATKVYGQALTLDPAAFSISSGVMMYGESVQSVTLTSTGTSSNKAAGAYPILPSNAVAAAGTDLTNYIVSYAPGTLTVTKATVVVQANNFSKVYGDANPVFTATYTGFLNGEILSTSGITGTPLFSTPATITSGIGTYNINVGAGSLLSTNYSFSFVGGTLTITKAPLNVRAVDKYIYKGDPLPVFTSVFTTLKAGDNPGVTYTVPGYSGTAGVYQIVPLLNSFANSVNYTISYTNGLFYVNPKGNGAKKLRPYLDCVEELLNPPSPSRRYIAHFFCINDNQTPMYVPIGVDNRITSTGSFDNSQQPMVFNPGNTYCNVPFDGITLKWEVTTFETTHKTSVSSNASSTSAKCSYITGTRSINNFNGSLSKNEQIIPAENVQVYPNPVKDKATIYLSNVVVEKEGSALTDSYGRSHALKLKEINNHMIQIDLTGFTSGVYFIRVKTKEGFRTVLLVKD
ncbi:MAG: MBG domain-containing protein [Ferruginibacter sp.]